MICGNCGNEGAYKQVIRWSKVWDEETHAAKEVRTEECDRCGDAGAALLPDVYWDGTPEHGLPDDPKTGQPMTFSSKSEKAHYLRQHHLVEAGDKVHGAPPSSIRNDRGEDARASAEKALADVRKMGIDQRRQSYLKILRESGRI